MLRLVRRRAVWLSHLQQIPTNKMTNTSSKDGSSFYISLTDGRIHKRSSMSQYMRARNYEAESVAQLPTELFPYMSSHDIDENLRLYKLWKDGEFDAEKANKVVGREPSYKETKVPTIAEVDDAWRKQAGIKMESTDPKSDDYSANRWIV